MSEPTFKLTVIRGGPHARTEFPLVQAVTTIGRSHKNTIVLNDHKVSRFHAEIARSPEGCVVRDLESANGVKINGSRVQSSALVASDIVTIGDTDFRVDQVAEAGEQKTVVCDEPPALVPIPQSSPPPDPPATTAPAPHSPVRVALTAGFQAAGGASPPPASPHGQTLLVMPASAHADLRKQPEGAGRPKLLELVPPPTARIEVAGLDQLVGWIARRSPLGDNLASGNEPCGIGIVGPAGCGKSLLARFVASRWQRPCFRLHLPYLVLYQPAEWPEKLAVALDHCTTAGPAVLAIEDVDRAGDRFESLGADVARGWMLALELLAHWVQTKTPNPFVVITARDPSRAHPTFFTQGGSLDEVFAIDLPTARERQQAIDIALRVRGRSGDALDPRSLADATTGFTIAQVNAGVNEALLRLGASPRDLATAELLDAFAAVRPLPESPADAELRRRALGTFRPASTRQP